MHSIFVSIKTKKQRLDSEHYYKVFALPTKRGGSCDAWKHRGRLVAEQARIIHSYGDQRERERKNGIASLSGFSVDCVLKGVHFEIQDIIAILKAKSGEVVKEKEKHMKKV